MNSGMAPSTGHDTRSLAHQVRRRLRLATKEVRQRLGPQSVQQYVFVAGMQRSGTNMLMEVLEASYRTRVFHETDSRAFMNYQMRDRAVIRDLAKTCRAPIFVVKALCELDLLTSLMDEFTPGRTLWVIRYWRDGVASALKSFSNFVPQWQRLAHEQRSDDWRGRGMSAATRTILRSLYTDGATEADGAALMWYYRNVLFFEAHFEGDPRVRVVFYEDLVRDPVRVMRSVFSFLEGEPFSPRWVQGIHARSVGRRAGTPVSSEIEQLCEKLYQRFDALRQGVDA